MKGFEDGSIVVELGQRSVECNQESIVDTWMAYVVTNCGDQECESIERLQQLCHGAIGGRAGWCTFRRVWW